MASFNKVILMGKLTRDPEVRYTQGGQAVAGMSMAINESYTDKNGEKKEDVVYVDVSVWGKQGESCGQYLNKGSSLLVDGRLKLEKWETQEGERKQKLSVVATRVQFLGGKPDGQRQTQGQEYSPLPNQNNQPQQSYVPDDDDIPF